MSVQTACLPSRSQLAQGFGPAVEKGKAEAGFVLTKERTQAVQADLPGGGRVSHQPERGMQPRAWWSYLWPLPWTAAGLLLAAVALALGARAHRHTGVLEVSGGWLGRRAARGVGPFNVLAITLGHVVLGSSADVLAALRAHERVHVRQYERWGPLFVPAYLASSLWQALRGRHPYRDNRFERPAFAAETAPVAEGPQG